MSGYLLDTNCVSELVRIQPEPRVMEWMDAAGEEQLYLSVLTLGEIRKGLAGQVQSKRRRQVETWLDVDLQTRFAGRILSINGPVAEHWGLLAARAKTKGIPLPIMDGLLAATALHYNLTMVTRNVADFASTLVPVLNPWNDSTSRSH